MISVAMSSFLGIESNGIVCVAKKLFHFYTSRCVIQKKQAEACAPRGHWGIGDMVITKFSLMQYDK